MEEGPLIEFPVKSSNHKPDINDNELIEDTDDNNWYIVERDHFSSKLFKSSTLKNPNYISYEDISNHDYNPPLVIIPCYYQHKVFNVIRDDFLIGGSKQRGMVPLLENSTAEEFVYAGPNNGFAQIALAYAAKLTNKKCTLFVARIKKNHPFTIRAQKMGAKIVQIRNGYLATVQREANAYVCRSNAKYGEPNGESNGEPNGEPNGNLKGGLKVELIPFGGGNETFKQYMIDNIIKALPDTLVKTPPRRIWLVGGSATLLNVLYKVFPDTHFGVVQVGKKIWDDQLKLDRTIKYIAPEAFNERAIFQPPYPTVETYDAKVWAFAAQYGESGDYIWNVAKD